MPSRFKNLPTLLLTALAVNGILLYLGTNGVGMPMGDLDLAYQGWASTRSAFGLSVDWVYPYLALGPIWLANAIAPGSLLTGWFIIWIPFQMLALAFMVRVGSKTSRAASFNAAYFWLAATLCLGPVAVSRLDAFALGFAAVAMVYLALARRKVATGLLTVALWIKVWPIAVMSAVLVAVKGKRAWFMAFAVPSVLVLALAFVLGADASVFSFLTDQSGRGIQIESPLAQFWLWPAVMGDPNFGIDYNQALMTFEVFGPQTVFFANLMTLVQIGALLITAGLGYLAFRRGVRASSIIFWASFTGVLDLIVFNKVGSPQYITWLVAPVIFGLLAGVPQAKTVGKLTIALSLMTWLIYPIAYDAILQSHFWETALLLVRNLTLLGALVYANLMLQKLGKQSADDLVLDQEAVVSEL